MKIRNCVECEKSLLVPMNSARKWCESCMKKRRSDIQKVKYQEAIDDGRIVEYRKTMVLNQRHRLEDDEYRLITRAKTRAACKGTYCDLQKGDLVIPPVCPVLKTPFVLGTEYAMSIDAIDPAKPYTKNNVQVISMKANAMKNSANREELLLFANWVLSNDT